MINLETCVMWIATDTSTATLAKWNWPGYLFLDVIHQVLQIQVIPVVHDGSLHKLSQSIPRLRERGHRGVYTQNNCFNINMF